jgi:anti-sigma regulatory factor (Ser/Thr protein kinase)/CheY-like chemotaxis protein
MNARPLSIRDPNRAPGRLIEWTRDMPRLLAIRPDAGLTDALSAALTGQDVVACSGNVDAVRRIRDQAVDVLVTDAATSVPEDLALAAEVRLVRPGVRVIMLAPETTHDDVVAALRAQAFACFTPPFDYAEIAAMAASALFASDWNSGIEVVSGLPYWMTLRVSCNLLNVERLVRFMTEREDALPPSDRDLLMTAFHEMLVNAMEHGAGFDPNKVIEVTAARTERAIVYHFRDPGNGFDRQDLAHAATIPDPGKILDMVARREEMGRRPGGFGMLLVKQIADELVYNERGNEVLLIKHLN